MAKFRVLASYRVYLAMVIEAETKEDAWDEAIEADGADFDRLDESDWEIDDVVEVQS
jgi:hypothetical protein